MEIIFDNMRRPAHNNCVQTTPDCALLFIVAQVSGAPDAERSAMKGKPMTGHASRYAIVAVEANVTLDDPDEVVGSNLWFVSAPFEEYLAADAIPAIRDFRPPH